MKKILIPIDFSDRAWEALHYAKDLAQFYKARLQFLHVVEEIIHPSFYVTGKSSIFEFFPEIKPKATKEMRRIFNEIKGPKVEADFEIVEGNAAHEILKYASKHQTDLIVLTTHGLTGYELFQLGSVAEKVVRRAECPVLTIKSFGKRLV